MYIAEVLAILEKAFPPNSSFNSGHKKGSAAFTVLAFQCIQLPLRDAFEKLNLSVISGEYISSDVVESLDEIESFVNTIPDFFSSNKTSNQDFQIDNLIDGNLIRPILQALKLYKGLLNIVNRILDDKPGKILFDTFHSVDNKSVKSDYLDLFEKNIKLAEADHKLQLSNEQLTELILISEEFKSQTQFKKYYYFEILIDKCNYLILKLHNRFEKDENNYLYSFNFQDKAVGEEEIPVGIFETFKTTSDNHYLSYHPKSVYCVNRLKDIDKKYGSDNITLTDYHFQIRRYKEVTGVEVQINNLIEEFKGKYVKVKKVNKRRFNRRAYDISYNYILNNKLSFLINSNASSEKISDTLSEIEALQHDTGVPNYFPYFKYCKYIIGKLDSLFKSPDNHLTEIKDLISTLDSYLKKAFEKIDDCKEQNFVAYQLPFEECLIPYSHGGNIISVFLSSSFYLPINYDKAKLSLDDLHNQRTKYHILFETHKVIEEEKEEILEIKADLDKKDNRSIEILSIFAAIVLFASGNIQIWKKEMPLRDALLFMLTFTYSLTVFVSLLWLITRKGAKVSIIHWVLIGGFILLGYLAFAFLIKWFPFHNLVGI
jgi:hypothetical protein